MKTKLYKGFIINPLSKRGKIEYFSQGALVTGANGKILYCGPAEAAEKKFPDAAVYDRPGSIITPGFIDVHTHLPQYPAAGCGDGNLLEWLDEYILPLESKFSDPGFAADNVINFFDELISNGTTTAVIYTTVHREAASMAFRAAGETGIRAYIGNSLIDANAPAGIKINTGRNIKNCEELINKWHGYDNNRLNYVVTPRFAGYCSMELMKKSAELAKRYALHIQTHLAESRQELKYIASLFPEHKNYTSIYQEAGLLTDKTILGHCVYLDDEELRILKESSSVIAHCPSSNRYLKSGIMKFRKYIDKGLSMGIGTDVAGGYSLSMINELKEAVECSKILSFINENETFEPVSPEEAFWTATMGGSQILGLENITGSLSRGKEADFAIIDGSGIFREDIFSSNEDILRKIIYRTEKAMLAESYVRGNRIYQNIRFR